MEHKYSVDYHGVTLTPLAEHDLESMRLVRNANREWFVNTDVINEEQQLLWYRKYLSTPQDYVFSAHLHDEPKVFVGAASLYNFDDEAHEAEFGRLLISSEFGGRGLGVLITGAICQIGFNQLKLDSVILEVFSNNKAALKTYQRVGFIEYNRKIREGREIILMRIEKSSFLEGSI